MEQIHGKTFLKITTGDYELGLNDNDIRLLIPEIPENVIKEEYLYKSYPRHATFINDVCISLKYITHAEFLLFINETGYSTESENEKWGWVWEKKWEKKENVSWKQPFGNTLDEVYLENSEKIPVMQVTWNDANEYLKWYSRKYGKDARLPSEEEWEIFAAKLYEEYEYTSDLMTSQTKTSDDYLKAITTLINQEEIHPPGYIWEWTENWFDKYPGGPEDKEFGKTYKVLRGGSLMSHPMQRIKEYRFRRCPTARSPFYSFRMAVHL